MAMEPVPRTAYQRIAASIGDSRHRLPEERFDVFWRDGYLGPLRCDDGRVKDLAGTAARAGLCNHDDGRPIPPVEMWDRTDWLNINVHDPHLLAPEIMGICVHPSIVNPVAQVLGTCEVALFQTRFRVKLRERPDPVPWHQDVGENNGGYRADGTPVPSVTVWLSVDGAELASGCLRVVPGTHRRLLGDWRAGFHSGLETSGTLAGIDTSRSVPIEAAPGEFFLFHSWTLHQSTANTTSSPRTGIVIRYVAPADAVQPGTRYTHVRAG
jgi:hypothetical protein